MDVPLDKVTASISCVLTLLAFTSTMEGSGDYITSRQYGTYLGTWCVLH